MSKARSRVRRIARGLGEGVLALFALFLIGRAVVEVVTVNPTLPETYRTDWGGPHYAGVLLVHAGPGVLAAVLTVLYLRHRLGRRRSSNC